MEALKRLVPGLEPDAKENKVCEMTIKYIEFMKTHVGSEADKEFLMNQIFQKWMELETQLSDRIINFL